MEHETARQLADRITDACCCLDHDVQLMEVCGTHTVSLFRSGVRSMLPPTVRMVSGPGCPVCVTSQGYLDVACEMARRVNVTLCTYGDMIRVPGRCGSLEQQRARGADVRVVYSARDAVRWAQQCPDRDVVFLAVGFETTAPATAAAIEEADRKGLKNFFVLMGHKLVIPAILALLSAGDIPIEGFLLPGHVSVVIGSQPYQPIVDLYRKPCVVAGFEPEQMLTGVLHLLQQMGRGEARLENVYRVAVSDGGNSAAQQAIASVFQPASAIWRAMGTIADSGLELREPYQRFDALKHFDLAVGPDYEPPGCRCGEVIQGKLDPADCALFAHECTPMNPIGPCMVSSEGTCAAWYKYGRIGAPRASS